MTNKRAWQFLAGFLLGYLAIIGLSTVLRDYMIQSLIERRRKLLSQLLGKFGTLTPENCPHCDCYHELEGECHICGKRQPTAESETKKETVQ